MQLLHIVIVYSRIFILTQLKFHCRSQCDTHLLLDSALTFLLRSKKIWKVSWIILNRRQQQQEKCKYSDLSQLPGLLCFIESRLCCQCGVLIEPNALNMCNGCMQTQIDITELIPKQGQLQMCNKCVRYLQPPNTWISAQLESRELLTVCLKKIKGLNKEVRSN